VKNSVSDSPFLLYQNEKQMFTSISWSQFGITVLSLMALYYLAVLWLYYCKDIQRIIQLKMQPTRTSESETLEGSLEPDQNRAASNIRSFDASDAGNISDLMKDIKTVIQGAKDSEASRTELFSMLKGILAQYPEVKVSSQKVPVNEFIIDQCRTLSIDLSVAQAHALWSSEK
jgi:hypothetical protein